MSGKICFPEDCGAYYSILEAYSIEIAGPWSFLFCSLLTLVFTSSASRACLL